MLNTLNGEAVLLNTVEIYCRDRTLDIHREPLFVKKGDAVKASLPKAIGYKYNYIWPVSINFPEGPRLTIGTKACNFLVTSSIRLDNQGNQRSSLGGFTSSFKLFDDQSCSATRIFLDKESVQKALILASDDNA
ncbi:hypothetical protein BGZ46_003103 [Entomortierella lignicola]|nr:hypothetical protein BGZ46_003103 [Entomortierella lignicola]